MTYKTLLVLTFVLCLLSDSHTLRRRRRSCSPRNCAVSGWSGWSACTAPCGNAGTQTRTRYVTSGASCGGSCPYGLSESQSCNVPGCHGHGSPLSTSCSCVDEWWDTCCDKPCTIIPNCQQLHCTSASNHACHRCNYDRGADLKAYELLDSGGYPNRVCEQRCSWRSDSKYCYPGLCPGLPSSCSCAPGFSGDNCMQMTTKPSMLYCLAKLIRTAGDDRVEAGCGSETALETVFTNLVPDRILVDWETQYYGPNAATYPRHPYIDDFKVGVVSASFDWSVNRGGSTIDSGNVACSLGYSQDNPHQAVYDCEVHDDFSVTFQHGDRFYVTSKALNGGYVTIENHDDASGVTIDPKHYYTGMEVSHTAHFTLDYETPVHCSVTGGCSDQMIDRGPPITKNGDITVRWSGWSDTLSGILRYEYEVYKMQPYNEELGYRSEPAIAKGTVTATESEFVITLTEPGDYCVLLTVDDVAGNHIRARRFLIFDDVNEVEIDPTGNYPLWVESAATNTSLVWQTDVQDDIRTGPQVFLRWPGHFYNEFHRQHKLLNAIEDHSPPLTADYEEVTGQPPITRSREAIPNINGIVRFETDYAVDHQGGRNITSPPGNWQDVTDIMVEEQTFDIPRNDGDSIRVWVKATDVMGNTNMEEVLVHVDSTPPEIHGISLMRHGLTSLAVHHSIDLFDMRVVFDAYDDHSGLHNIHWRLADMADRSIVHGEGQLAVRKPQQGECSPPNCGCIPKDYECYDRDYAIELDASKLNISIGSHDSDYVYTITVTNNAMLQTVKEFQVTVDTSPPHEGSVHDSRSGETDLDYQQDSEIFASWDGFFDRESGVMFYAYVFSETCMDGDNDDVFNLPTMQPAVNTTSTSVSWIAPRTATYHCTVVAYNRALQPSKPVCSDGITIDTTPPVVMDINIDDVKVKPGVMKDDDGDVWMVDENRYRHLVVNVTQDCSDVAELEDDIELWPTLDSTAVYTNDDCLQYGPVSDVAYYTKEHHFSLSWKGDDVESGIYDYEIGLSSTPSSLDPDIVAMTTTNSHQEWLTYHPNLVEGLEFYIIVKAINRAQLSTTKVIGPFFVEVTPPKFSGQIRVDLESHNDIDYLVGTWQSDDFYDDEDAEPLTNYQYAVGSSPAEANILSFTNIQEDNTVCQSTTPPTCVAIPTSLLDWHLHGDHTYYIFIRVENTAGLSSIAQSEPYRHIVEAPSRGVVYDIQPHGEDIVFGEPIDIDFQTSTSTLHARWSGFQHAYLDVQYYVSIGTSPGGDDVVAFTTVDGGQSSHSFDGLQLEVFKKYYVTVRAVNEAGSVTVSSDGVVVLADNDVLTTAYVYDGLGCTDTVGSLPSEQESLGDSDHHSNDGRHVCQLDIDYQVSTSSVAAHWIISDDIQPYITHVLWSLQRQEHINSSFTVWDFIEDFSDIGMADTTLTSVHLQAGEQYRSTVKFCHPAGCFQPVSSDGFTVHPNPPLSDGISTISYFNGSKEIEFSWNAFTDDVPVSYDDDDTDSMDYYEWTLTVKTSDNHHGNALIPWQRIDSPSILDNQLTSIVTLDQELEFTSCIQVGLRGYNKAGLFTTVYEDIYDCTQYNPVLIIPNIVIDSVGSYSNDDTDVSDVKLELNAKWTTPDAEYTPGKHKLSAVWPTLRYDTYKWKLVSDDSIQRWGYWKQHNNVLEYEDYDCNSPQVMACGQTEDNYVNIDNLQLVHGQRYYICIYSNVTRKVYEHTEQLLPELSSCSDGITVDHTPPIAGQVWIGWNKQYYQTSKSELTVHWESFIDVEDDGVTTHHSGIKYYEYAIGTSPNGVDVQDYVNVGITNRAVAHGLNLQDGITYFITVKATDNVGFTTEAVSAGVTIDTTPPMKSDIKIDVGGNFHLSTKSISAEWQGLFTDLESGISHYEWAVGSKPGFADVMSFTATNSEEAVSDPSTDLGLIEGHFYFVTVKAYNGAGLSTLASSWATIVDSSPPIPGYVYDGKPSNDYVDLDYQSDASSLSARWEGFHDPHTDIISYTYSIGTCSGCDDTMETLNVGLHTEITRSDIKLQPGVVYYWTVTCCNAADLCTTVTSDGIMVDNSPPVAGLVYDGVGDVDIQYQSSRTIIGAHWYDFHDPHSSLSYYEWRAGTTSGGDDIVQSTKVHLTQKVFISQLSQPLALDTPVYITVRAYNKAGLYVEQTSNGFIVDNTEPVISSQPAVDATLGSLVDNTQVWRTLLKVKWRFDDSQSHVIHQKISIFTHHQAELDIEPVKLSGDDNEYTFTDLALHDGDTYYVQVIGCNGAKLCTSATSPGVKVDSTPPTVGMFAVDTEHAADLTRHHTVSDWMVYNQRQGTTPAHVKLAWLGFADIHSLIAHYHVTIGTSYGGMELTPTGPITITYQDGSSHEDEGVVQTGVINISRDLTPGEHLYISIWAVNGVGLRSYTAHDTFEVVQSNSVSGILSLLRRCSSQSCQGHCTCGPQNHLCHDAPGGCQDVKDNAAYRQVEVFDMVNYQQLTDVSPKDIDYTPSQCAMAASWKKTTTSGVGVVRYEWSAGEKDATPGAGLFDLAFDTIWHDVGLNTNAVLTLERQKVLEPLVEYVFYVKAWYNDVKFAIYQSDGIMTDYSPPEISKSRKVKDVIDILKLVDTDFTTSTSSIGVSWKFVFRDDHSDIDYFAVSLSTQPAGEDISAYSLTHKTNSEFSVQLSGLQLQSGTRYYSNVRAYNLAGLYSTAVSDGFMVDTIDPTKGIVYDGLGLHDANYQNMTDMVSSSWHGFSDLQSSIDHYMWCIGSTSGAEDVLPCENVGLRLSASKSLNTPLHNGQKYFSKVIGVDAAGLQSEAAISNGITMDTTPPVVEERFVFGDNLVQNPSFEDWTLVTDSKTPDNWQVNGIADIVTSTGQDGNAFIQVYGDITQDLTTVVGEKYQVTFYCSHIYQSHNPIGSQEGFIQGPGIHHVFSLYQRAGHYGDGNTEAISWHRYVYYFTASEVQSAIVLGSVGRNNGIAIDNIAVRHVGIGARQPPSIPTPYNQYSSAVHVETQVLHEWNSVHASWNMVDLESTMKEYMWAIGTVAGGTQLQGFTSVGKNTYGDNNDLNLASGSKVHITVVGRNTADLSTVIYSDPILVDLTPPKLCCIKVNTDEESKYKSDGMISVSWQVTDPDSGMDYCMWAIGESPGSSEVMTFTRTDSLLSSATDLSSIVSHGVTLYTMVKCYNYAGLQTQITDDGVTIVTEQPDASHAVVTLTTSSMTHYPTQGSHQPQTNLINIAWQGFQDITGIKHYQFSVHGEDIQTDWYDVGHNGQLFTVFKGLHLMSYQVYQVYLRAVNFGGFHSDTAVANITIETENPITMGTDIVSSWPELWKLVLHWDGVFQSNSSLIYEVTMGTVQGGSDVMKWTETDKEELELIGIDHTKEHHVAITAINQAGLYNTANYIVSYTTN
ncbi:uncharacterized protein LOC144450798 isoform X2 [Glandiceps talaboti]